MAFKNPYSKPKLEFPFFCKQNFLAPCIFAWVGAGGVTQQRPSEGHTLVGCTHQQTTMCKQMQAQTRSREAQVRTPWRDPCTCRSTHAYAHLQTSTYMAQDAHEHDTYVQNIHARAAHMDVFKRGGTQCKHSERIEKCSTRLHTCVCKHTAQRHVYVQQMCTARACMYRHAMRMAQACTHVRHRYSVHTTCMCVQQSVHLQARTSRQINCMHITQRSAAAAHPCTPSPGNQCSPRFERRASHCPAAKQS